MLQACSPFMQRSNRQLGLLFWPCWPTVCKNQHAKSNTEMGGTSLTDEGTAGLEELWINSGFIQ